MARCKKRDTTLCDKFVSDLREVDGFLHNKTDRHDITQISLKVA